MSPEPTLVEIFIAPQLWAIVGVMVLWYGLPYVIVRFFGARIKRWWEAHRLFKLPPWRKRVRTQCDRLPAWIESRRRGTNYKEKL